MDATLRACLYTAVGALLAFSLAGCPAATTSGQRSGVPDTRQSGPDYVFPALAAATSEELPDDIEAVAAAVAARL